MPFFLHKETGEPHPRTLELLEEVAKRVEQQGIEGWFSLDAKELLGDDAAKYDKMKDTLDVWFDSGTTHRTVLRGSHAEESNYPADLYLEGSDQHRGWFHSSLLTGAAIDGRAPYNALLTHGFVVDGKGMKMSKSKGNVVAPQQVSDTLGAEILRLWVASTDYSGELTISDEILKRVTESYRRIRNTLRFLLANTVDFDPNSHALPVNDWLEIDRYALAKIKSLQGVERTMASWGPLDTVNFLQDGNLLGAYERYEFHRVAQSLVTFCSEDMGSFYLDVLKDRLYTCGENSRSRRSAQNALHHITHSLIRLMAPILSFTAEEAWGAFTGNDNDSVMLQLWHQFPEQPRDDADMLLAKWDALRKFRAEVTKAMEALREAGKIGSSLQAEVEIHAAGEKHDLLASLGDDLRFVLICSKTTLLKADTADAEEIIITPTPHTKCARCWHWREDVGHDAAHPELCGRCTDNLFGNGEARNFA
jgi:isoleucyl-tRNA synthetase